MRLLFFDNEIPYFLNDENHQLGGACVRQYAIAQGLIKLQQEVGVLTWIGASDMVQDSGGIELVEAPVKQGGYSLLKNLLPVLKSVRSYAPDIIFQKSGAFGTGFIALVAKILKIPFVYLAASDPECDGRIDKNLNKSARWSYYYGLKNAALIVCQNSYQQEHFQKRYPDKPMVLMHNPYYYKQLGPLVPCSQRRYVAWVGNFRPMKNLPEVLRVSKLFPNLIFKIAGKLGKDSDQKMKDLVEELKRQPNIEFVGYLRRSQVPEFLGRARLLLNTSLYEGFSNTFLEAMAAGTPIVTRNDIDPDHIIEQNNLGKVVTQYDDLADAIMEILDYQQCDQWSAHIRNYVVSNHDMVGQSQILLDALNKLEQVASH